jgi:hypothetical protein
MAIRDATPKGGHLPVTATNDFARLLRHLVRGEFAEHRRLTAALDERDGWDGYAEFLGAAFFLAVERRFQPGQEVAAIIRFVAEARAQFDETGSDIDPVAGETLVRAVLGDADASTIDSRTVGKVETVLLHKLLTDEALTDEQLDAFLDHAQRLAAEWAAASS